MDVMAILASTAQTAQKADKAGFINLKKMFTLPGTPTPSGNDPEYEQNVERTMQEQVNHAKNAISTLGIDSESHPVFQEIARLTTEAINAWGSKGNYTRNVADPAGFMQQINAIVEQYKGQNLSFSDVDSPVGQNPNTAMNVNDYYSMKDAQGEPLTVTNQPVSAGINPLIIIAVAVLVLILLLRGGKK